jgi:16S rRNA A1518/A1519 N6-dimethyltransferase RsmA/KsgA/DIM1 with predicted DNA glycosylase/AP lyase activity
MQPAQQHDLKPAAAARILREARITADDTVVEVGAGLGALTRGMLAAGATVHAIERDPARVAHLRQAFATELGTGKFHLWPGDALNWQHTLPHGWRVVANPPFNLTAPLVHRWLVEEAIPPVQVDLVLQRETALKL